MARTQESTDSGLRPSSGPVEESSSKTSKWMNPFEEMNRLFENFSARSWLRPMHMEWPEWSHLQSPFAGKLPHIDVIDREKEILIRAELPGVEKKDVDVSMTDHTVTIKATSSYEEKEEKGDFYRSEIAHGSFYRTVLLPADVDVEKVSSSFKNGLLEVTVPKQARESRKITIN